MIVSIGPGAMLTTRGGTRATRAAAMLGVEHPRTLAALAEDFGLVRHDGARTGEAQWISADDARAMTADEVAAVYGARVLVESGIREIPLEGGAAKLPVRHGGMLPEPLRGAERLLERMGLDTKTLRGSGLANQERNLESASDSAAMGLWVGLEAVLGFGRALPELFASSRFGASQGSAFAGFDRFVEIYERARGGRDSITYLLQSCLAEAARGNLLNLLLPPLDFADVKRDPRAIDRILPPVLAAGAMPNTGGVNLAFAAACASGLYALFGARLAMLRASVPGEYPMDGMLVLGVDATFAPYHTAPVVAGFSRRAPVTTTDMVESLRVQGRLPADATAGDAAADVIWDRLPADLRRRAMNESSAPFTRFSKGLVAAEAAAALPWMNFRAAIARGLWPSSRLLGIHANAGEGGTANLASMDQGIVTATLVALRMAKAHGAVPRVVQTHGTSTELNNVAEIGSLARAFAYAGHTHEHAVSAVKGLIGHSMGAASAVDMVMGVPSLLEQRAPGLSNFRPEDIVPRLGDGDAPGSVGEAVRMFRFVAEPVPGPIDSILIASEGFLSADAAAVIGHFPQEIEPAVEMLRDYNVPAPAIAEWRARAPENRERAAAAEAALRRHELTHRDVIERFGYRS
jgi:hypothetical protein